MTISFMFITKDYIKLKEKKRMTEAEFNEKTTISVVYFRPEDIPEDILT